ncbi:hypothetical protein F5B22DRAFT_587804 [Xylaria bambusicola]|uniref:uncharacterized protein n=1 Tax=Xylaria bambusicola TaxID=326684 RepID=UPI00200791CE|nr:uncharacterized protein F5B22DRAFT_587804 [Xylaria bambusicola]KAI0525799.1 hypothetical protein F5B22DRAFT_587804 [Xylaria bambusicola]
MTSQPRTRNDYTVGWVYALPKKQTAAIAILDQEHANLPKLSDDPNTYTLGSIGDHNIIITCLPISKIGIISTTMVATHIVHAFPSVKFSLIVKIGNSIPPKVKLSNVIVSILIGQYPGVI